MLDLTSPGAYARMPGGNLEHPEWQKPVVEWISWSINPEVPGPAAWDRSRMLWTEAGIEHFPWLHCHTVTDITNLIGCAKQYASPAIGLNIEDVVADFTSKGISLQEIRRLVDSQWPGPVHMATLPWVQNGQGWAAFDRFVAALEIFPDENNDSKHPEDCISHALAEGLTKVTLMLKTKNHSPNDYAPVWNVCHSLYTADDIPLSAGDWAVWKQAQPCLKPSSAPALPLTPVQAPYTGPYYGPSNPKGPNRGPTAKALKRFGIRMGIFQGDMARIDDQYNAKLEASMRTFQKTLTDVAATGQYGRATWDGVRAARVPAEYPHAGEYGLDDLACGLLKAEAKPPADPLKAARAAITAFCTEAEQAEANWHYTQNRPFTGIGVAPRLRHDNDCSSYVILAYAWAKRVTNRNIPDPSGYNYSGYGNTWDNLDGHPRVGGTYLVGDLAHYDGHVTICKKAGSHLTSRWSSFGREAGPEQRLLYYLDDFRFVCRPPL